MLDIQKLIDAGEEYYEKVKDDDSREASWRYCYKEFLKFRGQKLNDTDKDYLAVHLTAYLASWGMYRGSSFLLQEKNYKVHVGVIEILFQDKYDELWNLGEKEKLEVLIELKGKINKYYSERRIDCQRDTTDTLVTKILLGTLGCVPAYDANLCTSLRICGISISFRIKSMQQILHLYEKHRRKFEKLREKAIEVEGIIDYPIMKVLDACLWQYGYNMQKKPKRQEEAV